MQDGNPPSQNICDLLWRINTIASIAPNEAIEYDPKTREDLYRAAKSLVAFLEQPYRTVEDLCFSGTRLAAMSLACDIGLFQHLTDAKSPLSLSQLAELCNAEEALVMHVARVLLAHDYIAEAERSGSGEQMFTATPLGEHMTKTNVQAGLKLHFELMTPALCRATDYFRQNKYRMPQDMSSGLFNWYFSTPEDAFAYWSKQPETSTIVNNFIRGYFGAPHNTPVQWYDYEVSIFNDVDPAKSDYIWVDIGGGKGLNISRLLNKYPRLPDKGKFALQDLPNTISQIPPDGLDARIQRVPHDFFTPQPIVGSRAYCIENVLHNWDDVSARKILRHVRDAMIPSYSKLIISCMIFPDTKSTTFLADLSAYLLWIHNSGTRSEKAWRELIGGVEGLRVVKISFDPVQSDGNGVIEVERVEWVDAIGTGASAEDGLGRIRAAA